MNRPPQCTRTFVAPSEEAKSTSGITTPAPPVSPMFAVAPFIIWPSEPSPQHLTTLLPSLDFVKRAHAWYVPEERYCGNCLRARRGGAKRTPQTSPAPRRRAYLYAMPIGAAATRAPKERFRESMTRQWCFWKSGGEPKMCTCPNPNSEVRKKCSPLLLQTLAWRSVGGRDRYKNSARRRTVR